MKRIINSLFFVLLLFFLWGCERKETLILLNWGQYINIECVKEFEQKYKVNVKISFADSNEIMYTQIKAKTTAFDIAIPSDYMIHKLTNEGLIHKIDLNKIPNAKQEFFDDRLNYLRGRYFKGNEEVAVPYFWGTLGIMYRKDSEIENAIKEKEWGVFFNETLAKKYKIGMYNSARDAISAALLYLGKSVNTKSEDDFKKVEALLKRQSYYTWATDNLKQLVATGNLDIALVYSGDFFDMLYASVADGKELSELEYGMYVPKINNVWYDAMVIPKTSKNVNLAHKFINFMSDPEVAYKNAMEVGSVPSIKKAFELLKSDPDYEEIIKMYNLRPEVNWDKSEIYEDLGFKFYKKFEIILSNVKS